MSGIRFPGIVTWATRASKPKPEVVMTDFPRKDDRNMGFDESPLKDEHTILCACLEQKDGCTLVASYGDEEAESSCVHDPHRTFLCDLSLSGKFRIAGRAAVNFLCGMFACDFSPLATIGRGTVAFANADTLDDEDSDNGHGIGSLPFELIRSGDEEYMLLTPPGSAGEVGQWLSDYAETTDDDTTSPDGEKGDGAAPLSLSDESSALAHLFLGGADAREIVADLMSTSRDENSAIIDTFDASSTLSYARLDRIPSLVYTASRCTNAREVGKVGEAEDDDTSRPIGFDILCPLGYARMLWRNILSFSQVDPVGLQAFDTLGHLAAVTCDDGKRKVG